jgi:hypothetical protein
VFDNRRILFARNVKEFLGFSAVSASRLGDLSRRPRAGPLHRSIGEGSVFRVEHRVAAAMAQIDGIGRNSAFCMRATFMACAGMLLSLTAAYGLRKR